jgi:predicted dinucleotide-utilizing enzyme
VQIRMPIIMLDQCDPMILTKTNYVVHHYATGIYVPDILTMPQVDGFEIVKIYDYDTKAAKEFSETFNGKPIVCENLEDMTNGVSWVEAMGELPLEYLHLRLKNGMNVMIMNISTDVFPESCSFYASAYSKYGAVHSEPIGDLQFLGGGQKILEMLKEMVETGKPPVEYEVFLEPIAVIEAGQLAQKVG